MTNPPILIQVVDNEKHLECLMDRTRSSMKEYADKVDDLFARIKKLPPTLLVVAVYDLERRQKKEAFELEDFELMVEHYERVAAIND